MNQKMCSGSKLLELIQQYDPKALALIYDTYSPGIYRYAMRRLGDEVLAGEAHAA